MTTPGAFVAVLVPEGVFTSDGRMIDFGATVWSEPPLALMLTRCTEPCGRIEWIWRALGVVWAFGFYDLTSPIGRLAMTLRDSGEMDGIAVDLDSQTDVVPAPGDRLRFRRAEIIGVTQVDAAGWPEAKIMAP